MGGKDTLMKIRDAKVRALVMSCYSNDPMLSEHEKYRFKGRILKLFTY